jgi:predicted aspartyl protease
MITGRLNDDRLGIVTIDVRGSSGITSFDFVVDTGFTEDISLTPDEIDALGLTPKRTASKFWFADGGDYDLPTYEATILWDGASKQVSVVPLPQAHLIGMKLLDGSTVTFQVGRQGSVTIEPDTFESSDDAP